MCILPRMNTPDDLISISEARKLLNVSQNKMAALIRDRTLHAYTTPLDKRKKLVSRAEVEALKHPRAEAA